MSKSKEFIINETIYALEILLEEQTTLRKEKRISWLIALKQKRFKTQRELAYHLGVSTRSLERWSSKYQQGGIQALLSDKLKNKKAKIITKEIHQGLEKRINSTENPFLGYWDALDWVNTKYNVSISYHLLRYYLIKHFKTKLKYPKKESDKKNKDQHIHCLFDYHLID